MTTLMHSKTLEATKSFSNSFIQLTILLANDAAAQIFEGGEDGAAKKKVNEDCNQLLSFIQ